MTALSAITIKILIGRITKGNRAPGPPLLRALEITGARKEMNKTVTALENKGQEEEAGCEATAGGGVGGVVVRGWGGAGWARGRGG